MIERTLTITVTVNDDDQMGSGAGVPMKVEIEIKPFPQDGEYSVALSFAKAFRQWLSQAVIASADSRIPANAEELVSIEDKLEAERRLAAYLRAQKNKLH